MRQNQEQDTAVCGQSQDEAYLDALGEQMPAMQKVFTALDAGGSLNFLDIMAAISEMVAFYTDCDQIEEVDRLLEEKMSGIKCRFCS